LLVAQLIGQLAAQLALAVAAILGRVPWSGVKPEACDLIAAL